MSSSAATQEPTFGAYLSAQLDLPYRMITALADDFSEEQAKESGEGRKPLVWYLAHVIITRNYFLKLYAGEGDEAVDEGFVARYGKGSDGSADFSDAAGKAELLAIYTRLNERAKAFVATLAPEDAARAPEGEVRHPLFKQLGSALCLITTHDGYHAGQIGNLRRSMGKDPLFG
jgi:uncharacterized damage-inducible protein DinB